MPCRYIVDKERKLVISIGWDRLTFADMRGQQEEFAKDPEFNPAFNQLVDVTAVTVLDVTIEEAKRIARRGMFLPTSRRAVIASSVFHDRESALKWLGLDNLPPYDKQ
jgi:hypothetical protein